MSEQLAARNKELRKCFSRINSVINNFEEATEFINRLFELHKEEQLFIEDFKEFENDAIKILRNSISEERIK